MRQSDGRYYCETGRNLSEARKVSFKTFRFESHLSPQPLKAKLYSVQQCFYFIKLERGES